VYISLLIGFIYFSKFFSCFHDQCHRFVSELSPEIVVHIGEGDADLDWALVFVAKAKAVSGYMFILAFLCYTVLR
jgi:hypothetical protein